MGLLTALYSFPEARVHLQGYYSEPIKMARGTRQGCPLSPSIFNLMIEPLAEVICFKSGITGFQLRDSSHKINLFADDIILLLTNPESSSLPEAFQTLTQFSHISYYKVNTTKSLILDVGVQPSIKCKLQSHFLFKRSDNEIPYLGITLTTSTTS